MEGLSEVVILSLYLKSEKELPLPPLNQVKIRAKCIMGRGNNKYIGPEVGEEANVAGVEKAREREAENRVGWIWPLPGRLE